MRRDITTTYLLAVVITILLPGCGGESRGPEGKDSVREELSVGVEIVEFHEMETLLSAVGTVRSRVTADISSRVLGYVMAVRVKEGDRVRKGQLLTEIDSRESEVQLERARAALQEVESSAQELDQMILASESGLEAAQANASLAESTHNRFQELLTRKSVSQQEFDEVQARYRAASAEVRRAEEMLRSVEARKLQLQARIDQARAQLASAQIHKGYSQVTSPMSGLVTSKQVELGQLASPGSVLFTIEDEKNYRLEANVEESRIRYITEGDAMAVHVDALGTDLEGKVTEIVPTSDPGSRSFTVKIDLPPNSMLRSGLFGRARFSGGTSRTLTLPADSILQRGQLSGVYLVDSDQTVRFQLVKTGKQIDQRIEILSGLDQGDRVIVGPVGKLEEGDPVRIVNTNTLLDPVGSLVRVKEGEST